MTEGFIYQEIGRRIRELRGRERQKDWAARIGCDQGYISQVENGVTKPSLAFLKGVVSITGVSFDWVLTGEGPKFGSAGAQEPGPAAGMGGGSYKDGTLSLLARSPKLLQGITRLLKMEGGGKGLLEALGEMDEKKIAGLAAFLGPNKK